MVDGRLSAALTRLLLLFVVFGASVTFAALIPLVWHDKLYVDGLTIVHTRPALVPFSSSFSSAAYLLSPLLDAARFLGCSIDAYGLRYDDDLLLVNSGFGAIFFSGIAMFALSWRLNASARNMAVFASYVVLFAPFYFCITKELVLFLPALAILLLYRHGWVGISGALAIYLGVVFALGVYFRVYYLAFGSLLLTQWWCGGRLGRLYALYAVAGVLLFVLFDRLPLDLINRGRAHYLEGISASRIQYVFSDTSAPAFVLNRAVTFLLLLLPINLLALSPSYAPFVALQAYLTWRMAKALRDDGVLGLAAHAVLAYTAVSALFEPDFGSYFRHKVGILPFILLLVLEWDGLVRGAARLREVLQR